MMLSPRKKAGMGYLNFTETNLVPGNEGVKRSFMLTTRRRAADG